MKEFKKELEQLISKHSIENYVNMPDFILSNMICSIIESVGPSIKQTLDWHGCSSVCHPTSNDKSNEKTKSIAEELAAFSIHLRVVNPNFSDTDLVYAITNYLKISLQVANKAVNDALTKRRKYRTNSFFQDANKAINDTKGLNDLPPINSLNQQIEKKSSLLRPSNRPPNLDTQRG